jgi:hypothetical protein
VNIYGWVDRTRLNTSNNCLTMHGRVPGAPDRCDACGKKDLAIALPQCSHCRNQNWIWEKYLLNLRRGNGKDENGPDQITQARCRC